MSDWLLAALCGGGYEAIAMITARILYRSVMYDNLTYKSQLGYHTYSKGRQAGKSFWLAQTWGPALIVAPPAAAVAAVCAVGWGLGWLLWMAGRGIGYGAEWFIKTETLSAAQFRPHKVDEGALEAACAQAGRELAEIKGEAVPDDHYEAEMRAREKHAMDMEFMRRAVGNGIKDGTGVAPKIVDNRTWHSDPLRDLGSQRYPEPPLRSHPLPPEATVMEARDRLRAMPGYTLGGAVNDVQDLYGEFLPGHMRYNGKDYQWDPTTGSWIQS